MEKTVWDKYDSVIHKSLFRKEVKLTFDLVSYTQNREISLIYFKQITNSYNKLDTEDSKSKSN